MIFTHHNSHAPDMISHANSCAPGGECFAPLSLTEGVPQVGARPGLDSEFRNAELLKHDDVENHVRTLQGTSRTHHRHAIMSFEVL